MHVSLLNTWPSINRNIFFVRGKSSYTFIPKISFNGEYAWRPLIGSKIDLTFYLLYSIGFSLYFFKSVPNPINL